MEYTGLGLHVKVFIAVERFPRFERREDACLFAEFVARFSY